MKNKPIILIFSGIYLPGVKGGGPIRTISNLVASLSDEFDFHIITSDRDLGEKTAYSNVISNEWNLVGKAKVYYTKPNISLSQLAAIINGINYQVIYLNSFFNLRFTIFPLLLRKLGKIKAVPVILAPRGEFSSNALSLKIKKKRFFIGISSFLGLYNNLVWQASSLHEEVDINSSLNFYKIPYKEIKVCKNLPDTNIVYKDFLFNSNLMKICFLARISQMKNLDFVLYILKNIKNNVFLGIYGPKEDLKYWAKCEKIIKELPNNIKVEYFGAVPNEQVRDIISNYDLFFVPSKGENYGHVFVESFSAGTPVLVSDLTPWRNLREKNIGWDISLDNIEGFSKAIESYAQLTHEEKQFMRESTLQFAEYLTKDEAVLNANKQLFNNLI